MFKVNRATVAAWVKSGKIPAIKTFGGHARFHRGDVLNTIHAGQLPIPRELQPEHPLILIIDDHPSILKSLSRLIVTRYPAIRVDTAGNGVDALLKIGRDIPHVVILDLLMPKMDGVEVIRRLKSEPIYAGIRILAMSGYVKDEKAILKAGADAFFEKGARLKELLDLLPTYIQTLKNSVEAGPVPM
ncbi:response regulator [bacterium]|nr:response regulator [bacterium]